MQVRDFIDLLIEESLQEICIFDITSGNDVFNGKADKIPSKYEDCDICSIDSLTSATKVITINVDLGDE